jgi:cytochrome c2
MQKMVRRSSRNVGPVTKSGTRPRTPLVLCSRRKAGSIEGFSYSPANKEAGSKGLVWTEENLFKYLENPMAFMPKTKMIFPEIKDEQDRKDVIAYLNKFTK